MSVALTLVSAASLRTYRNQVEEEEEATSSLCVKERGDGRCNVNADCCSGRECNSFGFCQDRS